MTLLTNLKHYKGFLRYEHFLLAIRISLTNKRIWDWEALQKPAQTGCNQPPHIAHEKEKKKLRQQTREHRVSASWSNCSGCLVSLVQAAYPNNCKLTEP